MLIELVGQHPTSQSKLGVHLLYYIEFRVISFVNHPTKRSRHRIDNTTHIKQYCVAHKLAWFRSLLSRSNVIIWPPGSLPLYFILPSEFVVVAKHTRTHSPYSLFAIGFNTFHHSRLMCLRRNIHFPTKRHKINDINRIWFHLYGAHQGGNV